MSSSAEIATTVLLAVIWPPLGLTPGCRSPATTCALVTIRCGEIAQPEPCTVRPQALPPILNTLRAAPRAGTAPGVGAGNERSASDGITGSGSNCARALS